MRFLRQSCLTLTFIFACSLSMHAQIVQISEDFSNATGATAPPGWLVFNLVGHTSSNPNVDWRFDAPTLQYGSPPAPMFDPIAISDTDFDFSAQTDTTLQSPSFDSTFAPNTLLEFDYIFRLGFGIGSGAVEVFDGAVWNVHSIVAENDPLNSLVNSHSTLDITTLCGGSTAAHIRFRHAVTNGWHFGVDNVKVTSIENFSLSVAALTAPVILPICNLNLTSSELVTVDITNNGLPLSGYTVQLYNNGLLVNSVFPLGTFATGETKTVSFPSVDLSNPGFNTLEVRAFSSLDPDPFPGNNVPLVVPYNNPVTFGYSQNFDSLLPSSDTNVRSQRETDVPPGWENVLDDAASLDPASFAPDWYSSLGTTTSLTGPSYDHTQGPGGLGIYMQVEDSSTTLGDISLRSACLNLAGASNNPTVRFYLHSDLDPMSPDANPLDIDVINETTGGTVSMTVIPTIFGNGGGTDWVAHFVDLMAFGSDVVRVQFRSNVDNGNFVDDVAIDDFYFFDPVIPMGQAPIPGGAVLDVNNAMNSYGVLVSSGLPGPYQAQVAPGSALQFSWSGLPAQIVQMWGGPLLVNAANFPGLGQIDTGDGTTGMFGIPNGLFLVGDGANIGTAAGTLFDTFFFTGLGGTGGFSAIIPDFLPPGTLSTFQMIVKDPILGLGQSTISNAVTVIVTP